MKYSSYNSCFVFIKLNLPVQIYYMIKSLIPSYHIVYLPGNFCKFSGQFFSFGQYLKSFNRLIIQRLLFPLLHHLLQYHQLLRHL